MTATLQPLDQKFPIIKSDGTPTDYFTRWAQQRMEDIEDGFTLDDLISYLAAHVLQAGSGISLTPSGNLTDQPRIAVALSLGYVLNTGATGTNVGPELIAPRSGQFTQCKVVTKTSDPATALTFKINKNGLNIFVTNPTVAGATTPGTISTFSLANPLSVAADDLFTIDILSGSATWQATVVLE